VGNHGGGPTVMMLEGIENRKKDSQDFEYVYAGPEEYFENVIKIFRKDLICASHVSCLAATQGIWGSRNPNLKTNFEVLIR
jgi:hypothetical protein